MPEAWEINQPIFLICISNWRSPMHLKLHVKNWTLHSPQKVNIVPHLREKFITTHLYAITSNRGIIIICSFFYSSHFKNNQQDLFKLKIALKLSLIFIYLCHTINLWIYYVIVNIKCCIYLEVECSLKSNICVPFNVSHYSFCFYYCY